MVTGFEPFGGRERNLSWDVAARVASHGCPAGLIKAVMLPVSFSRVTVAVSDMLRDMRPDAVLMLGLAPKRKRISVERLAVNLQDARQPDNDGAMPVDTPVFPDGEDALFSTLPVKSVANAINVTGADADVSDSAGLYVCNTAFYTALHCTRTSPTLTGFIHLPDMPVETAANAVSAALEHIQRLPCQK